MTTIYNVDLVGNVTNNNGVLSGFSTTSYAIIQATPGVINSFEMVVKIRTGSDVTTYQAVVGQTYTNKHALQLEVPEPNTGFVCFAFPLGTNAWSTIKTSFSIQPNTDYWLKMVYDGSNNIAYYSTDGENYIQVGSVSNTNGIQWDEPTELGNDQGGTPFFGSIDLNGCYIKINNQLFWEGATVVPPITSNYKLIKESTTSLVEQLLPVPQMTGTSQDGFTVECDEYSSQWSSTWYTVFSPNSTGWYAGYNTSKPDMIGIKFPSSHYISKIVIKQNSESNSIAHNGRVEITTDGSTYTTLTTFTMDTTLQSLNTININANCVGYRLYFTDNASGSYPNNGVSIGGVTTYESFNQTVDVYKAIKAVTGKNYYKYKEVATGYRELTALTSNGSGTLDTGFYPSSNTKIRAKAIYSHYTGSYFLGHSSGTESDSFRFMRAGNTTYLDYGSGDRYNRIQGTYFTSTTDIYEFEIGNRYVKDIPTNTTAFSGSSVSFSTKSYTIKIFGANYDYGTLNYMQILENDVLQRDFVPCIDVTNDVVGLYDKVNDVFYQAPSGWTGGDYIIEAGTAQDYDFYENTYSYKAIKKTSEPSPTPTVRLMSRDPNNPTSYTIDTGYSFDGSTYSSQVGNYTYQLKMLFDQSDNVESITFTTSFANNNAHPGYYDNSGNWHELSLNSGTISVSGLNDFDYSKGISFGTTFSGSYTVS